MELVESGDGMERDNAGQDKTRKDYRAQELVMDSVKEMTQVGLPMTVQTRQKLEEIKLFLNMILW